MTTTTHRLGFAITACVLLAAVYALLPRTFETSIPSAVDIHPVVAGLAAGPSQTASRSSSVRSRVDRLSVGSADSQAGAAQLMNLTGLARSSMVVAGRVVDTSGAPVPNADVFLEFGPSVRTLIRQHAAVIQSGLLAGDALRRERAPQSARTHEDGRYSIECAGFSSTALHLHVTHPNFATRVVEYECTALEGGIELADIVLDPGGRAFGRVVDGRGAPVHAAEVRVELSDLNPSGGATSALGDFSPRTLTDENGQFEFEAIPAGRIFISVRSARHVFHRTGSFEVRRGLRTDCGAIQLRAGATLDGLVVDRAGTPIAGALIEMTRSRREQPAAVEGAWVDAQPDAAETDDRGRFTLGALSSTALRLTARHPDYAETTIDPIRAEDCSTLRIILTPPITVTGIVVAEHGRQPIEQFAIRARRIPPSTGDTARLDMGRHVPRATPSPTKHANGRFSAGGLDRGTYVFDVDAPGYARTSFGPVVLDVDRAPQPIEIALQRGSNLSGRVLCQRSSTPIGGARVELFLRTLGQRLPRPDFRRLFTDSGEAGPMDHGTRVASTRTQRDGSFVLGAHRPGRFRLVVTAAGHTPYVDDDITLDRQDRDLELALGVGGRLFGSVRNLDENVARVYVQHEDGSWRSAPIATDGAYEFTGLVAGKYLVRLTSVRGVGACRPWKLLPDVVIAAGESIRYDLDTGLDGPAEVVGCVFENGSPAKDCEVVLLASRDEPPTTPWMVRSLRDATAADGAFAIHSVPAGRYVLQLRRSAATGGATLLSRDLELRPQQVWRNRFDLEFGSVEVDVRDARGKPVAGVFVRIAQMDEVGDRESSRWRQLPSHRLRYAPEGTVRFADLAAGTWAFAIDGDGVTSARGRVRVDASVRENHAKVVVERTSELGALDRGCRPRAR